MNKPDRIAKRITRISAAVAARAYSLYENGRWKHPGTSITDFEWYRDFCAGAARADADFKKFRSNSKYRLFVESNNADEGRYYLQSLIAATPHYAQFFDRFRTNDDHGGPKTFRYGKDGRFAPTTLRYMKYLSDCERLFGSFDSKVVAEIGGGYGGLAKLFFDRFDLERYVLIDLPDALALSRRFLTACLGEETVSKKITFVDGKNPIGLKKAMKDVFMDLTVSTLAFSTCARAAQKNYLDLVLNRSNCGYLVMNEWSSSFGIESYGEAELMIILYKDLSCEDDPAWWWDDRVRLWTWGG